AGEPFLGEAAVLALAPRHRRGRAHDVAEDLAEPRPGRLVERHRRAQVELDGDTAARAVRVLATRPARRVRPHRQVAGVDVERRGRASTLGRHEVERRWRQLRSDAMQYRHLGRSGMMVSAISYGNWVTHGGQVGEDQAIACVRAALDEGVTTFDTADIYRMGEAERVLGKALRGVRRDSIEIFTKVFWPTGPNPNNRGLSRKHIIESCESSLERLGTDHVDLLQAHRFDVETPLDETLRAFDDLVRAGKVH